MKTFKVNRAGKLSSAIIEYYGDDISYSLVMKLIRKKDVKVNNVRTGRDILLVGGEEISVYYDGEKQIREIKEVYLDENIVVVIKPVGITSDDFYEKVKGKYPTAEYVHRLDRNTDGLMIFALNAKTAEELNFGFKNRTFEKYYLAEVYGCMEKERDRLCAWLLKDSEHSEVKIFPSSVKGATEIITAYKSIKRGNESSLVEVELITGKTHQIRAHLAFVGHFILGDGKYGKETINRKLGAKLQRLTAYRLILHFNSNSHLAYLNDMEFSFPKSLLRFAKEII